MPRSFPPGAVPANLPANIRLQIVSPCAQPPDGDGWLHEIKHDGHRLIAIVPSRGKLKLLSRNGHDRTPLFRSPFQGLAGSGRPIVLDGEIAAPDERGITHIDLLQARAKIVASADARRHPAGLHPAWSAVRAVLRARASGPTPQRRHGSRIRGCNPCRGRNPQYEGSGLKERSISRSNYAEFQRMQRGNEHRTRLADKRERKRLERELAAKPRRQNRSPLA